MLRLTTYFSAELTASWSGDGNRIAVFEQDWLSEETHLLILGRPASANELWLRLDPITPFPLFDEPLEIRSQGLAWRPGSEFVVFPAAERVRRQTYLWLTGIDLETGHWNYVLDNGNRVPLGGYAFPTWSSDGSQLVYADPGGNLVKWDYPDGEKVVIASGDSADWQRDALDLTCSIDDDCDDGNACTDDSCVNSACQIDRVDGGLTRQGCSGECWSGICETADCEWDSDCQDDTDICTIPVCRDADSIWATCDFDLLACGPDDGCCPPGCEPSSDIDCVAPPCVPKGDFCTSDAECCSGSCHPIKLTCK